MSPSGRRYEGRRDDDRRDDGGCRSRDEEGGDRGMIAVATRGGMKKDGVMMTEEMVLQEGINKREKWTKKDLKQFALD